MSLRNRSRLSAELLQPVLFDPVAIRKPDLLFPDIPPDSPLELEVGFGKGLHLVNEGSARPYSRFLGIEIEKKYVLVAATAVVRKNLSNVRVAIGDAAFCVANLIPSGCLDAFHVYFPDPWWKKRHHKRRLVNRVFIENAVRLLKTDGRLHFATDVHAYYQESLALLINLPDVEILHPQERQNPSHDMDYLTHFERKARLLGKPIFRWDLRKLNGS